MHIKYANTFLFFKKKTKEFYGSRAELFGSYPHSNGEDFSRSSINFLDSIVVNIITIDEIIIIIIEVIIIWVIIIYLVLYKRFDWKSNILIILDKCIELSASSVD